MDVGNPINGLQIKERYGADFEKQKRVQNVPRYVIYTVDTQRGVAERMTLRSAKKFCRNYKEN
jgi:hypothetical protein